MIVDITDDLRQATAQRQAVEHVRQAQPGDRALQKGAENIALSHSQPPVRLKQKKRPATPFCWPIVIAPIRDRNRRRAATAATPPPRKEPHMSKGMNQKKQGKKEPANPSSAVKRASG